MKVCRSCLKAKDDCYFATSRRGANGPILKNICKSCITSRRHEYIEVNRVDRPCLNRNCEQVLPSTAHPTKMYCSRRCSSYVAERNSRFALFNSTQADYDRLFVEQAGKCAICKEDCSTGRKLAFDHDHSTNTGRGLLCYSCNVGLGSFKDNPLSLLAAIDYLAAYDQG